VVADGLVTWAGPASARPIGAAGGHEPEELYRVDGFMLPGVGDRHVHIGLADPAAVLRGGVTAVRDLGWPPGVVHPQARASEDPGFDGPLIRSVGPMITCRGGYPTRATWAPAGTGLEVAGPGAAEAAVASVLVESTTPIVKVSLNADAGPVLRDEELVAICEAAHAAGARVTVHAQGPRQAERALGAGADEFAHCPWSERLSDDLIEAAAARARIVTTLDVHSYGRETPELAVAIDNLTRFAASGGRVVYGTDLGNGPIPPGIDASEVAHMSRAGLDTEAILHALTVGPLRAGGPGDVVALGANPFDDLRAFEDVVFVLSRGRRIR
jgi:imidazolonepropionase-like amidohydrolase